MTNPAGTANETRIVNMAQAFGLPAMRLVKKSQKDEADVVIGNEGQGFQDLAALFWKRIVKTGKKVRQPLGERRVVVMEEAEFMSLFITAYRADPRITLYIQSKAAEQVSVTKVLAGLRKWMSEHL